MLRLLLRLAAAALLQLKAVPFPLSALLPGSLGTVALTGSYRQAAITTTGVSSVYVAGVNESVTADLSGAACMCGVAGWEGACLVQRVHMAQPDRSSGPSLNHSATPSPALSSLPPRRHRQPVLAAGHARRAHHRQRHRHLERVLRPGHLLRLLCLPAGLALPAERRRHPAAAHACLERGPPGGGPLHLRCRYVAAAGWEADLAACLRCLPACASTAHPCLPPSGLPAPPPQPPPSSA